jgi:hypothetical protein
VGEGGDLRGSIVILLVFNEKIDSSILSVLFIFPLDLICFGRLPPPVRFSSFVVYRRYGYGTEDVLFGSASVSYFAPTGGACWFSSSWFCCRSSVRRSSSRFVPTTDPTCACPDSIQGRTCGSRHRSVSFFAQPPVFSMSLDPIFLLSVLYPAVPQLSSPLCLRQDAPTDFLLCDLVLPSQGFGAHAAVLISVVFPRRGSCPGFTLALVFPLARTSFVALPLVPSFGLCPLLVGFYFSSNLVFGGKVVHLDLLRLAQPVAARRPRCGPWRSQSWRFIFL